MMAFSVISVLLNLGIKKAPTGRALVAVKSGAYEKYISIGMKSKI
jgi:hypothetical protein